MEEEEKKEGEEVEDEVRRALELDRMEVRPVAEEEEEGQEAEETGGAEAEQPGVTPAGAEPRAAEEASRVPIRWILLFGGLAIGALALALSLYLYLSRPASVPTIRAGTSVHVITASLGGDHYVRFNLSGPFRDPGADRALARALPRIRNELILSGSRPDVSRWIQEKDLYRLEKHILRIVSDATGIPVGRLDLKGLAVSRYSDDAAVREGR